MVELALGPCWLVVVGVVVRALEGGLANHYHGMDFMILDDPHELDDDANEVLSDFNPKMYPKSVDLTCAVLMMLMTTRN